MSTGSPVGSPSNKLTSDVDQFFKRHPSFPVVAAAARQHLRIVDVPEGEAGLRMLAAGQNWRAVVQLAETLERQLDLTNWQRREQWMRILLVRVTALVKVGENKRALEAALTVGDFDQHPNIHPETGVSLVPFSLAFLSAYLPALCGDSDTAFKELYELLEETITQEAQLKKGDGSGGLASDVRRWVERQRRIRRALVVLHQEHRDFEPAVTHLNELINMSTDLTKQMVMMQQLGCLALKNGNAFVAASAFKKMKHLTDDDEDATTEAKRLCEYLSEMNDVLLSVFWGDYDIAVEKSRKLMMLNPYTGEPLEGFGDEALAPGGAHSHHHLQRHQHQAQPQALSEALSKTGAEAPAREKLGPFGTRYNIAAANAFLVLHQYASDDRRYSLRAAVVEVETLLKRFPSEMLAANTTVYNVRTLHDLESDPTANKKALFSAVLDYFRCPADVLPRDLVP